eukprot:TRINITY_DN6882_c0_g1_i1.p1 TRINITY_DN6882_c0_g1~~TRINITY_DN6882_c0_g1_i1.p1  ORF type:complete len:805 (+),score=309.40 TRINITY_DN6882_c0_g1_i1:160-2415(+)
MHYQSKLDYMINFINQRNSICPCNNLHKVLYLQAEVAVREGKTLDAIVLLDESIKEAKNNQFIQYEAMANETLGKIWHSLGRQIYAQKHFRQAVALYEEWGSSFKLDSLSLHFSEYLNVEKKKTVKEIDSNLMKNGNSDGEEETERMSPMDVQLMVKMSEAISVEMSLEQMLDSMMRLIIENAGAQKGMFLLGENEGDLLLVAEGDVDQMNVNSLRAVPLYSLMNYPHQVINYVARTKKMVITGSSNENDSGFVGSNNAKSVLCAPIMKNNQFRGVIYLENNLLNDAFSEKRVKSVNLIAAQMVVHLENAKFSQLLESEKKFKVLATELETVKKGLEEFIDVLCHELRNPLNGIYGSKQLMEDQLHKFRDHFIQCPVKSAENLSVLGHLGELEDMLGAISTSSDHLKDIVDTVLNASMVNRKIQLNHVLFNPKEIVAKVGLMYKAKFKEKSLDFFTKFPEKEVFVMGDPQRLTQILVNIVSNAIKFVEVGGITIEFYHTIEEDDLILHFAVRDTGIGMTDEEISKLFKPFTQANSSIQSRYGGSGLGLKISKEIIEEMGGTVRLESEKGVGTSCFFTVICKTPGTNISETLKRKRERFSLTEPEETPSTKRVQLRTSLQGHILVVEDNRINQKLLQKILEGGGYTSEVAHNGKEAYDLVVSSFKEDKTSPFQAILMDFEMPVMTGIEATQKIRQFEDSNSIPHIPIIGVSANAREAHSELAYSIGMNSYLTKPFQKQDIFTAIQTTKRKES